MSESPQQQQQSVATDRYGRVLRNNSVPGRLDFNASAGTTPAKSKEILARSMASASSSNLKAALSGNITLDGRLVEALKHMVAKQKNTINTLSSSS